MSRPPMPAASRNMSACRAQAESQVGWRLIVASSAKINRPRCPVAVAGPRARTFSIKVSISGLDETGAGLCWESFLISKFYTEKMELARAPVAPSDGDINPWIQACRALGENVVDLQWLVHDRVPFRACGGAPFAVLGERKLQRIEQRNHFLTRRHMRKIWTRAERFFVELIERRKPAREKLAIDHTLGKALHAAEAHALGQFTDAFAH